MVPHARRARQAAEQRLAEIRSQIEAAEREKREALAQSQAAETARQQELKREAEPSLATPRGRAEPSIGAADDHVDPAAIRIQVLDVSDECYGAPPSSDWCHAVWVHMKITNRRRDPIWFNVTCTAYDRLNRVLGKASWGTAAGLLEREILDHGEIRIPGVRLADVARSECFPEDVRHWDDVYKYKERLIPKRQWQNRADEE